MTTTKNRADISEALKEYLKAVYKLSLKYTEVRITDISKFLGISKPSVNRAVNALKNIGLVEHRPYGSIFLTENGTAEAERITEKDDTAARFLSAALGISYEDALADASVISGKLSEDTLAKMKKYIQN